MSVFLEKCHMLELAMSVRMNVLCPVRHGGHMYSLAMCNLKCATAELNFILLILMTLTLSNHT